MRSMLPCLHLLAACTGAEAGRSAVRDSAGITIVANTTPSASPYRLVAEEPVFDVGGSGAPEDEFTRVSDALRLSDGSVVVSDAGAQELRVFDSEGIWLRTIGRRGGGPGEFEGLEGVFPLPGDTMAAYDFQHRRLSFFLPDGSLVGEVTLQPGETAFPQLLGRFADGTLLLRAGRVFGPGEERSGVVRDTARLRRFSPEGIPGDTVGTFPGSEYMVQLSGSGQRRGIMVSSRPFGRSTAFVVGPDYFVVATGEAYEIRLYSPSGEPQRIIRRAHAPRPVTDEDLEAYIRGLADRPSRNPEIQKRLESMAREAPRPEVMPAHGPALLADDGTLWVAEYAASGQDQRPRGWSVFSAEGHWLGDVTLPARFTPYRVTGDLVVGRWRDPDDVDHVRVYRLRPPAR